MKVKTTTVIEMLSRMRRYFQKRNSVLNATAEDPIRSELYNFEQMRIRARIVAGSHKILQGKRKDKLLKRLDEGNKCCL